jgi:hypothetical protein
MAFVIDMARPHSPCGGMSADIVALETHGLAAGALRAQLSNGSRRRPCFDLAPVGGVV